MMDGPVIGRIVQRVLRFLHLSPLSLAEKCRIMFGAAVLLCLVLALLIPYVWMRQLAGKVLLDTNKAKVESVLLRSHFRPAPTGDIRLAELNERGVPRDPNERSFVWLD